MLSQRSRTNETTHQPEPRQWPLPWLLYAADWSAGAKEIYQWLLVQNRLSPGFGRADALVNTRALLQVFKNERQVPQEMTFAYLRFLHSESVVASHTLRSTVDVWTQWPVTIFEPPGPGPVHMPGTRQMFPTPFVKLLPRGASFSRREYKALLACLGRICAYCGEPADGIDHVLPRKQGGTDDVSNLVACCWACNNEKGDQTWNRSTPSWMIPHLLSPRWRNATNSPQFYVGTWASAKGQPQR